MLREESLQVSLSSPSRLSPPVSSPVSPAPSPAEKETDAVSFVLHTEFFLKKNPKKNAALSESNRKKQQQQHEKLEGRLYATWFTGCIPIFFPLKWHMSDM